jgi:hypothetical protein
MSHYDDLLEMIAEPTDDCIVWPHGKDGKGYGKVRHEGRQQPCHRLALSTVSPAPTPEHEAAHGPCHNRLCVNPRHLSWKTPAENQADRLRDGTDNSGERNGNAKLTWERVRQIRWLAEYTPLPQRHLAKCFGVSESAISAIINRKKWVTT